MEKQNFWQRKMKQKGQSLVEVAVFLPVALIMIAGLVELSLYLITQNRVTTATREAARFGANGGENAGMVVAALNSVTQTLQFEIDRWDMWTIRGTVNDQANGFDEFLVVHAYGISQTVTFTETNARVTGSGFQDEVLQELQQDRRTDANGDPLCGNPPCTFSADDIAGLQFVGMFTSHDVDTILGLDSISVLEDTFTVKAMHVFRVPGTLSVEATEGCWAMPIGVNKRIRSVSEGEWSLALSSLNNGNFSHVYPNPPQDYIDFVGHTPFHSLDSQGANQAQEGDVFLFQGWIQNNTPEEQAQDKGFAYLAWNRDTYQGLNELRDAMTWPGTSDIYRNLFDDQDTNMNIGDPALLSTTSGGDIDDEIVGHFQRGRILRLIIWYDYTQQSGPDYFIIDDFADFEVMGYFFSNGPGDRWLLLKFIKFVTDCGQPDPVGS